MEKSAEAIFQQNLGTKANHSNMRKEAVDDKERFNTNKTKIDNRSATRWQNTFKGEVGEGAPNGEGHETNTEQNAIWIFRYTSRAMTRNRCFVGFETRHMPLRTDNHFGCRRNIHRTDHTIHRSRKAPKKAKTEDVVEEKGKCDLRLTPKESQQRVLIEEREGAKKKSER